MKRLAFSFTIPSAVGPCSYVGDTSPIRCMIADQQVVPGNYSIYVTNTNGQSATQTFTVTSGQTGLLLQITSPATGQTFVRGQDMPIVWTIGQNAPSSANLVLDLYTEAGSKVGTIAIPQITADSYTWHIPGFPQNYMCTMQYPNGLCGSDIPTGQYYIKATATADGFNPNAAVYATAQSGVFTINLQ